jgi:putative membrane protein
MSFHPPGAGTPEPPASAAPPDTPADLARHAAFGFLMGAADTVPGVSGGTVAFVCGIYARLIDAIRDASRAGMHLVRGRAREGLRELRLVDWALLVPLLLGILAAVFSLAAAIEHLLEEEPVRIAGFFCGLVLASVVVSGRLLRRRDARAAAVVVLVGVVTFLALGLRTETSAEAGAAADAPLWAYPLSAMVAICAMILPGISGSFLLVTLGMYDDVLAAVNDRELGILVLFALGCVVGLALFSRLLAWLLDHHHDLVVAAMIGLMLGSVRVLWPWPGGTDTTELARPSGDVLVPVVLGLAGFALVMLLGRLGALREEPVPHPG